jgi:tetratricopeptide (TPR) repeat protein
MTHEEAFRWLGLEKNASQADIKAAYKKKMMFYHPDHNAGSSINTSWETMQVKEAYELLKNRSGEETKQEEREWDDFETDNDDDNEPRTALAWFISGRLLFAFGQYETAIEHLTGALALDPQMDKAYFYRAQVYEKGYETKNALSDYSRAITLNSSKGEYYAYRGNLYYRIGLWVSAKDDFEKSLELGFSGNNVRANLAWVNYKVKAMQYPKYYALAAVIAGVVVCALAFILTLVYRSAINASLASLMLEREMLWRKFVLIGGLAALAFIIGVYQNEDWRWGYALLGGALGFGLSFVFNQFVVHYNLIMPALALVATALAAPGFLYEKLALKIAALGAFVPFAAAAVFLFIRVC